MNTAKYNQWPYMTAFALDLLRQVPKHPRSRPTKEFMRVLAVGYQQREVTAAAAGQLNQTCAYRVAILSPPANGGCPDAMGDR